MSEKRIRVAIIGAGMIANAGHIPAWKHLEEEEGREIRIGDDEQ